MRLVDVLSAAARDLCGLVSADACSISWAVGDVLIVVAEHPPDGTLELGQGLLVPDFPRTAEVLRRRRPYAMTLDDPDADPAEAALVRRLGYNALLMLPLEAAGKCCGLAEIYRRAQVPFEDAHVRAARDLLAAAGARIPVST